MEACGAHYASKQTNLVIIIDGLDHAWRAKQSIDELDALLSQLLPIPEGVALLLVTQPISDEKLPACMKQAVPRDQWLYLPPLRKGSVNRWLRHHADEMRRGRSIHEQDYAEITNALYNKTAGHPLHLKYTLKAIQERNDLLTTENINRLPSCPHSDITAYYSELWDSLPEESRMLLHLLAACPFTWPKSGLFELARNPPEPPVSHASARRGSAGIASFPF